MFIWIDPLIEAEDYSSLFNNNNDDDRQPDRLTIDKNENNEEKSNENDLQQQQQQVEIIENNIDNNNNVDESTLDEFLLDDDDDQILPILGSGDNGDVNDLFDELELLLSVSYLFFFILKQNIFIFCFYSVALIIFLRTEIDFNNYYSTFFVLYVNFIFRSSSFFLFVCFCFLSFSLIHKSITHGIDYTENNKQSPVFFF